MVTKRRGSRKGDHPGSSSLESLNDETKLKLLDMQLLNNAINEVDIIGQSNSDDENEEKDKNDENISTPKMNTLIGFLRISNFISASTVIFILILNLMSAEVWATDPSQNILTTGNKKNMINPFQSKLKLCKIFQYKLSFWDPCRLSYALTASALFHFAGENMENCLVYIQMLPLSFSFCVQIGGYFVWDLAFL